MEHNNSSHKISILNIIQEKASFVRCSRRTIVAISHFLEDMILNHNLEAILITGFQNHRYWLPEVERYKKLLSKALHISLFSDTNFSELPNSNNLNTITLDKDDPLTEEYFLCILTKEFSIFFAGKDLLTNGDYINGQMLFQFAWTLDPILITSILDVIKTAIQTYKPQMLNDLNHAISIIPPIEPNLKYISQFAGKIIETLEEYSSTYIQQANIDPLTNIPNRRVFMEKIVEECERSTRYTRAFSIIFIDLDNFKYVNDTYGHLAGDWVLKEVAALITANKRGIDLASRYGGEEFVMLLPETKKEDAANVAERIRNRIKQHSFSGIPLTASFGVADNFDCETLTEDNIMKIADQAMYQAKYSGKDKVVLYSKN